MIKPRPVTKSTTAYRLLQRIKRLALTEPKRIDMATWLTKGSVLQYTYPKRRIPACGTIGCIGGWTTVLTSQPAIQVLGLTREQSSELFYNYQSVVLANPGTKRHAEQTARHIDLFCAKYKQQLMATVIHPPLWRR